MASRALEKCEAKLSGLEGSVERLAAQLRLGRRSQSLSDLSDLKVESVVIVTKLIDEIIMSAGDPLVLKKLHRCHHCHTPLDEEVHVGVKQGIGNCTLDHWPLCSRDIPKGWEVK